MARRGRKRRLELEAEYWRLLVAGVGRRENGGCLLPAAQPPSTAVDRHGCSIRPCCVPQPPVSETETAPAAELGRRQQCAGLAGSVCGRMGVNVPDSRWS